MLKDVADSPERPAVWRLLDILRKDFKGLRFSCFLVFIVWVPISVERLLSGHIFAEDDCLLVSLETLRLLSGLTRSDLAL